MIKRFPLLALCAILVPAAIVAGCGGVPGNAVAEVDGTSITSQEFDHWMNVAAKSRGGAAVPKPPDFAACVAPARKAQAKPAKGQPKVDGRAAQDPVQAAVRPAARSGHQPARLVRVDRGRGEGPGRQGHGRRGQEGVRRRRRSSRSRRTPTTRSSSRTRARPRRTSSSACALDTLSNKIRDKVVKGKDKVSDAQIAAYYNKNKASFGQPETRDLRVVLTKTKAKANQAKAALQSGAAWPRWRRSTRSTTPPRRRAASCRASPRASRRRRSTTRSSRRRRAPSPVRSRRSSATTSSR